jgi:O-antigen ligase
MKKMFVIYDSMANRISYYHLLFFLVSLPFDLFYSEVILISLVIHTAIHVKKQQLGKFRDKRLYILSALYLLSLLCTLYSSNRDEAVFDLTKELAILIFPLLFCFTSLDLPKYKEPLLFAFALTCVITVLYLYADALRVIFFYKIPIRFLFSDIFLNHHFSEPIGLHATYFSMYVGLSLVILLYRLTRQPSRSGKYWLFCFCLVLFAGMVQLASRAVFAAESIIILLIFPFFIEQKKSRGRFIGVSILLLTAVLVWVMKNESFNERYFEDLKEDLVIHNSSEGRLIRWRSITELIAQRPIAGYGTGSETGVLKTKYLENKLFNAYHLGLNTHNQYLGYLLRAGLIGLFLYLFVIVFGFYTAWHYRDICFAAFMVIISTVSFSENILDVNKGIFFFSFFFSFFVFADGAMKSSKTPA